MAHTSQMLLRLAMLLTAPALAVLAPAQAPQPKAHANAQQSLREAWARSDELIDSLIKKVSPSLVQIMVTSYGPLEEEPGRTGGRIGEQHVIGSGFIIDREGYIATNAHVVKSAQHIQVVLQSANYDG